MKRSPGPDETLDRLSPGLKLLQRRKGHRATSDDTLLAWAGVQARPDAQRVLDLGTGKGTVALLMLAAMPEATGVGLEAEPISADLARRNVVLNQMSDRLVAREGDLRDPEALPESDGRFDLITGAPPFMPLGSGVLPQDRQRAVGRFELRGGVEGYTEAAVRWAAPGATVVILMDGLQRDRAVSAFDAVGLAVAQVIEIRPRPDRPAVYQIIVGGVDSQPTDRAETWLAMRGAEGEAWTPEFAAARRLIGVD